MAQNSRIVHSDKVHEEKDAGESSSLSNVKTATATGKTLASSAEREDRNASVHRIEITDAALNGSCFSRIVLIIEAGESVCWYNSDSHYHTVSCFLPYTTIEALSRSDVSIRGTANADCNAAEPTTWTLQFRQPGIFAYECRSPLCRCHVARPSSSSPNLPNLRVDNDRPKSKKGSGAHISESATTRDTLPGVGTMPHWAFIFVSGCMDGNTRDKVNRYVAKIQEKCSFFGSTSSSSSPVLESSTIRCPVAPVTKRRESGVESKVSGWKALRASKSRDNNNNSSNKAVEDGRRKKGNKREQQHGEENEDSDTATAADAKCLNISPPNQRIASTATATVTTTTTPVTSGESASKKSDKLKLSQSFLASIKNIVGKTTSVTTPKQQHGIDAAVVVHTTPYPILGNMEEETVQKAQRAASPRDLIAPELESAETPDFALISNNDNDIRRSVMKWTRNGSHDQSRMETKGNGKNATDLGHVFGDHNPGKVDNNGGGNGDDGIESHGAASSQRQRECAQNVVPAAMIIMGRTEPLPHGALLSRLEALNLEKNSSESPNAFQSATTTTTASTSGKPVGATSKRTEVPSRESIQTEAAALKRFSTKRLKHSRARSDVSEKAMACHTPPNESNSNAVVAAAAHIMRASNPELISSSSEDLTSFYYQDRVSYGRRHYYGIREDADRDSENESDDDPELTTATIVATQNGFSHYPKSLSDSTERRASFMSEARRNQRAKSLHAEKKMHRQDHMMQKMPSSQIHSMENASSVREKSTLKQRNNERDGKEKQEIAELDQESMAVFHDTIRSHGNIQ